MKFIHISDTHNYIPPWLKDYDGWIVHTGDVSDNSYESEFDRLYAELEPVKDRLIMIPGNHDYGYQGNIYLDQNALRFDKFSYALQGHRFLDYDMNKIPLIKYLPEEGVCFIGLNSCAMTSTPFDFARGSLDGQLQIVDRWLQAMEFKTSPINIILMLHHHPFLHTETTMKLIDSPELFWFVQKYYYCIQSILFGHKHIPDMWCGRWGVPNILAAGKAADNNFMECVDGVWSRYDHGE